MPTSSSSYGLPGTTSATTAAPRSIGAGDKALRQSRRWLMVEASAAGLGAAALLCWASVCLLASFRPKGLPTPYWSGLSHLRSDTCGIAAFSLAAVCLWASEYLRWRRRARQVSEGELGTSGQAAGIGRSTGRAALLLLSAAEIAAALSVCLVTYLSVNAVTHPATLNLHVTHLLSWPTEGTLRFLALVVTAVAVALLRYLWPQRPQGPKTHELRP
jgi:hypothetical protein